MFVFVCFCACCFLHCNKEIIPAEPVGLTNLPLLFYGPVQRAIDKEWGCNDDHFPALTLYFKGLGHDIIYLPVFVSVPLPNQK